MIVTPVCGRSVRLQRLGTRRFFCADPYAVLGVRRDAKPEQIKQTFKRLALRWHPDQNPGDKAAEEKFKKIVNAYEQLTSAESQFGQNPYAARTRPGYSAAQTRESFTEREARARDNWKEFLDNKETMFANYTDAWEKAEAHDESMNAHRKVDEKLQRFARTFLDYEEDEVRTTRADEETGYNEVDTVEIKIRTPEGTVEELVEERWEVSTFRGVMQRLHPLLNTLTPKTRLACKLFSSYPLSPAEKDEAIELWGQSVVSKQELAKSASAMAARWSHSFGKKSREQSTARPHWESE